MIVAGVDIETTGLDKNKDDIIELAIYVCRNESPDNPIFIYSSVFNTDKWNEDSFIIHGITKDTCNAGIEPSSINIYNILQPYNVDVIMAHNVEFDYKFINKVWPQMSDYTWLCTQKDLPHNAILHKVSSRRLMHLAVDYGFKVDGWHRALDDAHMVCKLASKHDITAAIDAKFKDRFIIKTWGSYDHKYKEALKNLGFRWNSDDRKWFKVVVSDDLDEITESLINEDWSLDIQKQS